METFAKATLALLAAALAVNYAQGGGTQARQWTKHFLTQWPFKDTIPNPTAPASGSIAGAIAGLTKPTYTVNTGIVHRQLGDAIYNALPFPVPNVLGLADQKVPAGNAFANRGAK